MFEFTLISKFLAINSFYNYDGNVLLVAAPKGRVYVGECLLFYIEVGCALY